MDFLITLDIETAPLPEYAADFDKAALDPHRNFITAVAYLDGPTTYVDRDLSRLTSLKEKGFITHGGKFDAKVLLTKGAPVRLEQFQEDTLLMALAHTRKIPLDWLERYHAKRRAINKALGKQVHRQAGRHSLKTLAPYFLGVEPFWEEEDHSNAEYAAKDVLYTRGLFDYFSVELRKVGTYSFYKECLVPWNSMLCEAEMRGLHVDWAKLDEFEKKYTLEAEESKRELLKIWQPYLDKKEWADRKRVISEYSTKAVAAINRLVPPVRKDLSKAAALLREKQERTAERYQDLCEAALSRVEPFNMDSSDQIRWLLKERGYNIVSYVDGKESSGAAVLQSLADEGAEDCELFLTYRKAKKLTTAYFPAYKKLAWGDMLHSSFHVDTTRTGRLSSSDVNLQQISKNVQSLFTAPPGRRYIYRDVSAIEPRLIAYHTECPELSSIFLTGTDFHSENVREIMGLDMGDKEIKAEHHAERDFIKEFGLSLMYGAKAKRIQVSSIKRKFARSFKQCQVDYERFREKYSTVFEFKAALEVFIKGGNVVTNLLGRPLNFDGTTLEMTSLNTLIQSGGSDLLLASTSKALIKMREKGLDVIPAAFIHDAAILDVAEKDAEEADRILEDEIKAWKLPTKWGTIPMVSEGSVKCRL